MEGTGSARKKGGQVSLAELPLFSGASSRQQHFTLVLTSTGVKDRGREREMEIHPLCSTLQQVFLVILSRGILISSLLNLTPYRLPPRRSALGLQDKVFADTHGRMRRKHNNIFFPKVITGLENRQDGAAGTG